MGFQYELQEKRRLNKRKQQLAAKVIANVAVHFLSKVRHRRGLSQNSSSTLMAWRADQLRPIHDDHDVDDGTRRFDSLDTMQQLTDGPRARSRIPTLPPLSSEEQMQLDEEMSRMGAWRAAREMKVMPEPK